MVNKTIVKDLSANEISNKLRYIKEQKENRSLLTDSNTQNELETLELLKKYDTNRYTHARQSQLMVVAKYIARDKRYEFLNYLVNEVEQYQLTCDGYSRKQFLESITAPIKWLMKKMNTPEYTTRL